MGVTTHQILTTPNREPKHKKIAFQIRVLSIVSDIVKFAEFNETTPEPKTAVFGYPAHSLQDDVLLQTVGTDGNITGSLWGQQLIRYQQPQTRNPKPQRIVFQKLISYLLSDVENFVEFSGTIICQIRGNVGAISSANLVHELNEKEFV